MKKLLALLLALTLLCSALPAFAADVPLTRAQAAVQHCRGQDLIPPREIIP